MELATILTQIKAFVFDVDGVLTDGTVIASENGEHLRTFNVKDGYAIDTVIKLGYHVIIISGGNSAGVRHRLQFLGIKHIHLGIENKEQKLREVAESLQLNLQQIAYMGDDYPDFDAMNIVGLPSIPSDAIPELQPLVKFISSRKGGKGAVRELIELVLANQGKSLRK